MKVSPRSTARSRSLSVYREPGHNGRDRHGAHRRMPNPATSSRTRAAPPRNVLEYFILPFVFRTIKSGLIGRLIGLRCFYFGAGVVVPPELFLPFFPPFLPFDFSVFLPLSAVLPVPFSVPFSVVAPPGWADDLPVGSIMVT